MTSTQLHAVAVFASLGKDKRENVLIKTQELEGLKKRICQTSSLMKLVIKLVRGL